MYAIEIIGHDTTAGKVKVHYVGYASDEDKWRDAGDIVDLTPPKSLLLSTFSLYQELALVLKIKRSLQGHRKANPKISIEMDFDKMLYDGGLKRLGTLKCN